ncbi:hypothetical protein [Archaeoglobus profundus]|uniref:DUF1634 domain-containing protein n=1 Tax=Archaeoglobus profundus (strain DSM 5631 / JCM 9629 / NBRC 100127 / Av18) TaxID=572546 RepID=D2RFF5_ARCPA|nr:hypothetical protein [Archaeoglobus profundus]ADB58849.1 hypothetical protein Arcpr_1805 [Archaeoglobus profundus DSM 5631]
MEPPKPPTAGIVYGEIVYWITIVGMIVGIAGLAIYLSSGGVMNSDMISDLLKGETPKKLWEEHSILGEMPESHWYLSYLSYGDAIAMLGIVICSLSAVIATWATALTIFIKRELDLLFGIFAVIVAIIMTLAALGIIAIHH